MNQLVGNHARAEDIRKETCGRAKQKVEKFRGDANLQSWLSAIAMNLARDHFRRIARRPETADDLSVLESVPDCHKSSEQTILKQDWCLYRCINI
ncbi:MAG: hypothetical protein IIC09_00410 [Proteobacteria bacterium]|nr:hypothetical protein [Pseudomonadota bacterium]